MKHNSTTHRIDLRHAHRYDPRKSCYVGAGETIMMYLGEEIGSSRQPLYAAARYLLDRGLAAPSDRIVTYRGTTPSLSGVVGVAARYSVQEDDRKGLYLSPFKPFDSAVRRQRGGSPQEAALTA